MTRNVQFFEVSWAPFALRLIVLLVLLGFGALPVLAQFDTGTITGTVTDPSGAVVPHAAVTIVNTGTSIQRTLQADSNGSFVASAVPFGNYIVSATASGFKGRRAQPSC